MANDVPDFIQSLLLQQQHRELVGRVEQTERRNFITERESSELAFIGRLVQDMAERPELSSYWLGRIHGELISRGLCVGCGKDHTAEELATLFGEEEPKSSEGHWVQDELNFDQSDPLENINENMVAFGVAPVDPETPLGAVYCVKCGMKFSSLEDRMLRPPKEDGCIGCQDKSAHG